MLSVSFVSLKSYLCTSLTTQNTTESSCIISHAHNTPALQSTVFLTGIHPLLVTNKGESDYPSKTFVSVNCKLLCQLSVPSQGKADYAGNVAKTVLRTTARNVDIT